MTDEQSSRRAAERLAVDQVAHAFGVDPSRLAGLLAAGDPEAFSRAMSKPEPEQITALLQGLLGQLQQASHSLREEEAKLKTPPLHDVGAEMPEGTREAIDSILEFQGDVARAIQELADLSDEVQQVVGRLDQVDEREIDALDAKISRANAAIADRMDDHRYLVNMLRDLLARIPGEFLEVGREARAVTEMLGPQAGQGWAQLVSAGRLGDKEQAHKLVERLVPACLAAGAPELAVKALGHLQRVEPIDTQAGLRVALDRALAMINADQLDEGTLLLDEVVATARDREEWALWARATHAKAQAAELQDLPETALPLYRELVQALPSQGPAAPLHARACLAVARLSAEEARPALKAAAMSAANAGIVPLLVEASVQGARLADQADDREEAIRLLFAARAAVDGLDEAAEQRLTEEAMELGRAWGQESFREILDRIAPDS